MRNPLSKKVVGIQPSGIRKFFDVVNEMKDAISLGVGEPDFDTPWRIREEGIYTLEKGRTFYTSNAGLKELKIEICKYLDRKVSVQYDYNDEVIVTVGGSEGIDIALRAMLDPGDEVLIPQPSYVSYLPCTILADGVPVVIPLQHKNEFKLTAEELEAAITPKTKILVMPFPNNPTGSIMTKEDLEPIVELVKKHDLFVISDEIYSELSYKGEHVSIASFEGMKERTILINGFSKGMQRQAEIVLGISTKPDFILFDETFDGLDPAKRALIKNLLNEYMADTNASVIVSSHDLHELEGLCDHFGLINGKKLVLDSSIKELSEGRAKFRIVFKDDVTEEDIKSVGINVKSFKRDGRIIVITVKGSEKETAAKLNTLSPIMVEPMPLSLEEVFLDEMEGTNYDFSKIF